MVTLKMTINDIRNDLIHSKKGIKGFISAYLYNPGFRTLLNHRIGKYFSKSDNIVLRQIGSYYRMRMITKRSCDISYNSKIGKGLKMNHPIGIIIGNNVIIEENVTIFQQVTLGSHGKRGLNLRYPKIESGVIIYAGAKIIGGVTIGTNAVIGANSVVNIDVPPNCIAVGIPCKILQKK